MLLFYRKYGNPKNKPIVVLHGVLGLSDDGLSGTAETMTFNVSGEYNPGDPIEVKLAEDGESGILLTLGTGEEYHLVPVAE